MMATVIRHPAYTPPMPAVTRILSQFDRDNLAGFIEVALALLDLAEGDADMEDSDEDCCTAFDDCSATPRSDDGRAGDADDAEDEGEAEPDKFDAPTIDYAFDQRVIPPNRVFRNSGLHVDNDAT